MFKSKARNRYREAAAFCSARVITLLMDMLIMLIMVTLCQINDKFAKIVAQVIVTIANYVLSKKYVFIGE